MDKLKTIFNLSNEGEIYIIDWSNQKK